MIVFQPDVKVPDTYIDWYWNPNVEGTLKEIYPEFIVDLSELVYSWNLVEW